MRYELKRNKNGMITQCDTNADGGNIYAQREEINKVALKNLQRPTPGKLGNLSNLQIFNFQIGDFDTSSARNYIRNEYNTTVTTGNVTDCIMFNVNSILNKASYYNIVDITANVGTTTGSNVRTEVSSDSYIEFYLLENIETSTSSLGRKIPRRNPVNGTSSGTVTINTTGAKQAYQYTTVNLASDSVNVPSNIDGLRCSGLALKSAFINFTENEDIANIFVNFMVYVNISSVSNSY
jgi:hypothetical protein